MLSAIKNLFSLLIISAIFILATPVNAQLNPNSISIGYAPTSIYLNLQPGEKYNGVITFWNLSPNETIFSVLVRGFKQVEDFPGTSRVHTLEEEERDPYSASKWFFAEEKEVKLTSNEYYDLEFSITVPKDAASGEYHTLVNLISPGRKNRNDFSSAALTNLGSGPAILINVGNEIKENANVEFFRTDKKFYEYPPVQFETMYVNRGNTHITPAGDIVLSNLFGQEIDRISFNSNSQSILRGNSGKYKEIWGNNSLFIFWNGKFAAGPIKAKLITTYMSKNPGLSPLSATTQFWILPWKLLLLIIFAIITIIFLATRKRNVKIIYIEKPSNEKNDSNI